MTSLGSAVTTAPEDGCFSETATAECVGDAGGAGDEEIFDRSFSVNGADGIGSRPLSDETGTGISAGIILLSYIDAIFFEFRIG